MIAGTDTLTRDERAELRGSDLHQARPQPVPARHPRRAAARRQRRDQGRGPTSTASTCCAAPTRHLSAEDIALGYKQLLEVERGWRDMKPILDLRPVYHRLEDRIRAHVLLCWLALLLIRDRRDHHRPDLDHPPRRTSTPARGHLHRPRRHLPPAHRAHQSPTRPLTALELAPPKKIIELAAAPTA